MTCGPVRYASEPGSSVGGLLREARAALTGSEPGLGRFRLAGTTVLSLLSAVVVLGGLVMVAGRPVIVAVPGVVLVMIASLAVREAQPGPQALSIAALVPAAATTVTLAALTAGSPLVADAVFVGVAAAAVLLRMLGPRGLAAGLAGFVCYFLALFIRLPVGQLPATVVALVVGAAVCFAMRYLLRPRHPDRDLRRMRAALGARAAGVVELLDAALREGRLTARLSSRLRSRVQHCGDAAIAVEQHLHEADDRLLADIDNDELAVRVFDFQLATENLGVAVRGGLETHERPPEAAGRSARPLGALHAYLERPGHRPFPPPHGAAGSPRPEDRLDRAVRTVAEAWRRVVDPHPDDVDAIAARDEPSGDQRPSDDTGDDTGDDTRDDTGGEDPDRPARLVDTGKQAIQVALACGLSIAVGIQLSPTRWFWATITAFVVYIGTSSRGEILSKGWQRVLGTTAGVVSGVLIATAVGGNTVLSVAIIVVCLFLAVYLLAVSMALMMFFITTMLALLYGLLGMFTVHLLVVRMEETAAGALIGIAVAYVVFPTSTRRVASDLVTDFLQGLSELLGRSVDDLTCSPPRQTPPGERARDLRDRFVALQGAVRPITEGMAGVGTRPGTRRTMQVLAACEHHGRMLSRLTDESTGVARDEPQRQALEAAVAAVRSNLDAWARGIDDSMSDVAVEPAARCVDALEAVAARGSGSAQRVLPAVARHLQAIDQAVCARAHELGAAGPSSRHRDEVREGTGDRGAAP